MNYEPRPIATRDVPDSIRSALRDFYSALPRGPRAPDFSVARALREMSSPTGLRDGYERELLGSFAIALGRHYDPHRVCIPYSMLATERDMTAASGPGGGHLVGEEQGRVVDLLRGWSIAIDGGAQVLPLERGNLAVPRDNGGVTTAWLSGENVSAPEVGPILGEVQLTPKTVATYVEVSHLLNRMAPQLELFLRQSLVGAVGQAIDIAAFGGTGIGGQPLGIMNTAGVGIVAGASLGWAGVRTIRKSAVAAGARESHLMFVGGSTTQDVLAGRERLAGSGKAIWDDSGNVAGLRAVATNRIPLDALVCGDFSKLAIAIWGGLEVEVNPFANFQAGIQGARVMASLDIGVLQPGAFSVASGVN